MMTSICFHKVITFVVLDLKEPGVQAAAVGSDVQLVCNSTEHNVQWKLNGQVIPETVNHVTQGGHLNLTVINLEANGTYTCHNKRSGAHLDSRTLLVGSKFHYCCNVFT